MEKMGSSASSGERARAPGVGEVVEVTPPSGAGPRKAAVAAWRRLRREKTTRTPAARRLHTIET